MNPLLVAFGAPPSETIVPETVALVCVTEEYESVVMAALHGAVVNETGEPVPTTLALFVAVIV